MSIYRTGTIVLSPSTVMALSSLTTGHAYPVYGDNRMLIHFERENYGRYDALKISFTFMDKGIERGEVRITMCGKYSDGADLRYYSNPSITRLNPMDSYCTIHSWDWNCEIHKININIIEHDTHTNESVDSEITDHHSMGNEYLSIGTFCINALGNVEGIGNNIVESTGDDTSHMKTCVACEAKDRCFAIVPCGHIYNCVECSEHTPALRSTCSECGVKVYDFLRIYP